MSTTQHHGQEVSCHLNLDGVTHVGPAPHNPVDAADVAESVRAALQSPLGYPPLSAATVPGDRVVVAMEPGLPLMRELAEGVLRALEEAGVDRSLATFVHCQESEESQAAFSQWAAEHEVSSQVHDPSDENSCSVFGVSQSGHALRLNRKLCDADIVLPVGVTSVSLTSEGYAASVSGVFPQFSDEETIARHRAPEKSQREQQRHARHVEIEESDWLLGVGLAVQVVPGAGGTLDAVFAGEPKAAAEAAVEKYREVWQRPVDAAGDLVIVTLTCPSTAQTWQDVGRALLAAADVLAPGGAIAICTQLAEAPGPALRRLRNKDDYQRLEHKLERDAGADSGTALVVCRALERGPVYLYSQLDSELVESLGFAPIASDSELQRLVRSHTRPLVLEDAHRLLPVLTR